MSRRIQALQYIERGSLKKRIFDELLPRVCKPARYIGNEVNMVRKDPAAVEVRVALLFPDVYEVGMSYMGFAILYHVLNKLSYVYAERVFLPWPDMAEQLRQGKLPLYSLESFSPLSEFDVVGVTLQHEMTYTSVLEALDLTGIAVWTRDRHRGPLVVGGGPAAFNPEPMADFFDLFVIGDGEEAVVELVEVIRNEKAHGSDREQILRALSRISGVYVPQYYRPHYRDDGAYAGLSPIDEHVPKKIRARILTHLDSENYPTRPLLPNMATTHDRVVLEISRGCSRGCRFCNAGMIYRPVRQRPVAELVQQAVVSIRNSGYDEISLLSLSTGDYDDLLPLLRQLHKALGPQMVNISFPSLRVEKFTDQMAYYARQVRKSGLTLAPEAGSQRLRQIINKTTRSEELLRAMELAFQHGWKLVKLYFMIGQPGETDEDLLALAALVHSAADLARRFRGTHINISISPFVPKPFTPFQWAAQNSLDEIQRKVLLLNRLISFKNVRLSWHEPERSVVEGILARGDRRLGAVIYNAWQRGSKLEGWNEFFSFAHWQSAMAENGLSIEPFTRGYPLEAELPWDHIMKGVSKTFLRQEWERALEGVALPDCHDGICNHCGLMAHPVCREIIGREVKANASTRKVDSEEELIRSSQESQQTLPARPISAAGGPVEGVFMRVHYRRGEQVRFISHLDFVHLLIRAMRRAEWPLVYSEGFNPHPKISFAFPLATGHTSNAEYFDVQLLTKDAPELLPRLQSQLPEGVELLEYRLATTKPRPLTDVIKRMDYSVDWPEGFARVELADRIVALMAQPQIFIERRKGDGASRRLDIRPFIAHLSEKIGTLEIYLNIHQGATVRIEEVLSCLFPQERERVVLARVHRKAAWMVKGTEFLSPLAL